MKYLLTALLLIFSLNLSSQIYDDPEDVSPLLIGEEFPDADLKDIDGKDVELDDLIDDKKTIIIFYRGGWCPYCNTHLSQMGEAIEEVKKLGYQIIAISPEDFSNIKGLVDKHTLDYTLLSDIGGKLIQEVGIAYSTPTMNKIGMKMMSEGEASDLLPVPALFVLDEYGEIAFEYIHIDHKIRITKDLLLAILKNIEVE